MRELNRVPSAPFSCCPESRRIEFHALMVAHTCSARKPVVSWTSSGRPGAGRAMEQTLYDETGAEITSLRTMRYWVGHAIRWLPERELPPPQQAEAERALRDCLRLAENAATMREGLRRLERIERADEKAGRTPTVCAAGYVAACDDLAALLPPPAGGRGRWAREVRR